jgi:predicted methyltransferase
MRRRAFFTIVRVAAAALPLTAALTIRGAAQDFMAPSGAPADVFPRPERPVADIVSPIWHGEKERDAAGESRQLVRLLGIKPGMTVADIGAGSGYYVVRLAPIIGPKGRIIAEDVVPEYLQDLRNRVRALGLQNVTIRLGEPHDPRLPAHSLDAAILVHMYHEVAQPYGLLYNLAPALKPGARVGIVDAAKPSALRACSRWISRDWLSSAHGQQRLSGDLRAAVRRKPHTAGRNNRVYAVTITLVSRLS